MRTLKKALCLVLVLSMVMGIGVIGAGAAYSDADQIEYQEAVDVMTAIGVMQGVGENTFDPDGTFTRAQAAKMLSYMILGETAAEALPARSDFTDVSADQWFSKYIGFGVSEGYLAGMGDGSFKPDDPVTGYQWAKMLLCALGYDPKTEGFEGVGYEINVAKYALTKLKLFAGNEGADYNVAATREEAALYAFNMIQQNIVEYKDKTTIEIGGTQVVIGQGSAEFVDSGKKDEENNIIYKTFMSEHFPKLQKVTTTTNDAFGRPAVEWKYDKDSVGTYADEPILTYTSKVTGGKLYTDLGRPAADELSVQVYVDGAKWNNWNQYTKAQITSGEPGNAVVDDSGTGYTANGVLTEVYETADNAYTIVVINTYIGYISAHTDAKPNADGEITEANKEKVTITADGSDVAPGTTYTYKTTAFSEDNEPDEDGKPTTYVLFTVANGAVKSAVAVEPTTVTVSSVTSGKSFVADGNTYNLAAKYVSEPSYSSDADATNSYDIYCDSYGYVLKAVETEEAEAATGYVIVTAVTRGGSAWTDGKNAYQAKIIGADGQEQVVDIDKDSFESFEAEGYTAALVQYTIEDGKYTFTAGATAQANAAVTALEVNAGVSEITYTPDGDSAKTVYANSETIFFLGTTDDDSSNVTYKVVTGIANMGSVVHDGTKTKVVAIADASGILKAMLIVDAKDSTSTSTVEDIAYLVWDADASQTTDALGTYKTYDAVIGGEITTVKVQYSEKGNDGVEAVFGDADQGDVVVAELTYNEKGLVIGKTDFEVGGDVQALTEQSVTAAPKNGIVGLTDGTYSLASDCAVYVLEDGTLTAGTISDMKENTADTTYTVTCVTVKGIITTVYVTVTE